MGELSFEVTRTRLIRSSQIAQRYFHAAKPDHAEEVLSMKFVADNQPAEPVQPGEQPLHHPAAQVAAQRSAVLILAPVLTVGLDHFDSVFLIKMSVERVRVVRLVTNQLLRQFVGKLPASVSSTSFDSCGEAESIVTARGTLFPAAMAMILVPLPRLVLPCPSSDGCVPSEMIRA